jgi:hypothetical protein
MTATRELQSPPIEAESLRAEIFDLGQQIDRRLGNRPGTAEKAVYFWHWPPNPNTGVDVLTRLHADAVEFLHGLIPTTEGTTR